MGSIIFSNPSTTQTEIPSKGIIESVANKILGSTNPQAAFSSVVNNNPDAKKAMDICNQYGNGDPKAAFMNYAAQNGKNAFAQTIMNRLGLN